MNQFKWGALIIFVVASPCLGATKDLRENWQIQSSNIATQAGSDISQASYQPVGWYPATVPSTLAGVLVDNKIVSDPFYAMNFRLIPGTTYPINSDFSLLQIPDDSPFANSWWYRTEFESSVSPNQNHVFLIFNGINYTANIWLNGKRIAGQNKVVGTFRKYKFEMTSDLKSKNVLAIEVFPPFPNSLANTWDDWNPMPADKNTGLWRKVQVKSTGSLVFENTSVISHLNLPDTKVAYIKIKTEIGNLENRFVEGVIEGQIESHIFSKKIRLAPFERKNIIFKIKINSPKLWWPSQMGDPNLYSLNLKSIVDENLSDEFQTEFGIREITSELQNGSRLFKVNGKPIFIRGGGWAPNIFLKPNHDRDLQELKYIKDLGLNAIRFEGKFESEEFLRLTDHLGLLTMPGFACCSMWERGSTWTAAEYEIAEYTFRDQLRAAINHPSTLVWLYGSDIAPPPKIEQMYLRILGEEEWPNPTLAGASDEKTLAGPTGVKMTGPYDYVPPSYWTIDKEYGGAFGFNTETSVGPAVPPIESLEKMFSLNNWPINQVWNFHTGVDRFQQVDFFTEAMERRYGKAQSIKEYAMKAQVLAYDGHRAMFEAYTGRKYQQTTGIIQWMLNNSWPSLIWHLYDFYLRPGGSYFGAKKALEPFHIQYNYGDNSISLINSTYSQEKKVLAQIDVYDFKLNALYHNALEKDLLPDSVQKIFALPEVKNPTQTYFINLTLKSSKNKILSRNFYWLSTQKEVMDWEHTDFTRTPTLVDGDLTLLNNLPKVEVESTLAATQTEATVIIKNLGKGVAFFARLKLSDSTGEEILPVLWEDNYISLMPGEEREVSARYESKEIPKLSVSGWNF